MNKILKNSWALFLGMGFIMMSYGFQGSLLGVRAVQEELKNLGIPFGFKLNSYIKTNPFPNLDEHEKDKKSVDPKEFLGTNKVETVKAKKMKLGDPDESGRRKPIEEKDSEFEIKADLVIKALGFDPENLPDLFGESNLQVSRWGTIKADFDTMETSIPGVFAAGDIVRGASLVVWAIKDGRDAAISINNYLKSIQSQKVA